MVHKYSQNICMHGMQINLEKKYLYIRHGQKGYSPVIQCVLFNTSGGCEGDGITSYFLFICIFLISQEK